MFVGPQNCSEWDDGTVEPRIGRSPPTLRVPRLSTALRDNLDDEQARRSRLLLRDESSSL